MEASFVRKHRVADLPTKATRQSLGKDLGLEAPDVCSVERLARHVRPLDPVRVDEEQRGALTE
jgi:hypothetical protein